MLDRTKRRRLIVRSSNLEEPKVGAIPPFTASLLESETALLELEAEWNALFQSCHRPSLCALHAWAVAWWQAFGGKADGAGQHTFPFLVIVRDSAGTLVAALPMYEERPPRGSLQVRRLRSVGFLGRSGAFDMTEEPIVLIRTGSEVPVFHAVAELLKPHLRAGRWDLVFLRYLEDGAPSPFPETFRNLGRGLRVKTDERTGPFYVDLPPTWAEYRKFLSKSMRDNLGYYPRLLTRDGHDWSIRIVRDPAEIVEAAQTLVALHRQRAHQLTGTPHHNHIPDLVHSEFLESLLLELAHQKRAFIGELIIAGEVIATQAFVEDADQLMVYYSGYLEAWYRYSPVFVIEAQVFKEALERGVKRIDFLRVEVLWKSRWGATTCLPMPRLFIAPRRPQALLRIALSILLTLYRADIVERLPIIARSIRNLFVGKKPKK